MHIVEKLLAIGAATALTTVVACGGQDQEPVGGSGSAVVHGAAYTTLDATALGCLDNPTGVVCNHYTAKDKVYVSGGPVAGGLSNGSYYFAVLVPGSQNGGFVDGADGNLSSPFDASTSRTFTVADGQISAYGGTHATGTSLNGKLIIELFPYADTTNPGGVYILAVCQVGATSPRQCKFDAFKVEQADGGAGGSGGGGGAAGCGGSGATGGAGGACIGGCGGGPLDLPEW